MPNPGSSSTATLTPGTRLGRYEITGFVAAGGMGEVYRAKDPSLEREIAVKLLPAGIGVDAERRARFEREARLAAGLNHPGIVTIHSVEQDGDRGFITMELVEGTPLAALIPSHGFSIDRLLAIAVPLANAVSAAHEKGITHRDLKPANVMVGNDAAVKVLDFGIAKRHDVETATGSAATASLATAEGRVLGTIAYMSPEQAQGQPADTRSDVFSLGTILYEMATGRRPFSADTDVATLAAIVRDSPAPITDLNQRLPKELARIIRRAMAKDPDRRQQSAKDLRNELEELRRELESGELTTVAPPSAKRGAIIPVAATVVIALLGATALWPGKDTPAMPAATTRLTMLLPDGTTQIRFPVISSDGSQVAFVAQVNGTTSIWVRPLDSLHARSLSGTQNAQFPFWSPDSRFLAFFADGKLKKIALAGGSPQVLCDAPQGRGGSWNQDDVIILAPDVGTPLHRVSADGGNSVPLTRLATSPAEQGHRLPHFLPDGRHFVFAAWGAAGERTLALGSLDSPQVRPIISASLGDAYLAGSHLLFTRDDGTLVAQRFDLERATLAGEAFPLAEDVESNNAGSMQFSVAITGAWVYSTRSQRFSQLTWIDRQGRQLGTVGSPAEHSEFVAPALAPDATRVALTVRFPASNFDVVVQDLAGGQATKLTSDPSGDHNPVWAPDSERLVFSSNRNGLAAAQLYETTVAAGRERPLVPGGINGNISPETWSSDGRHLVLYRELPLAGETPGLWILPLTGDRTPRRWFEEKRRQRHSSFSPDSRWIAYAAGEFPNGEIWIRSLTNPRIGRRIGDGEFARWRADGRELFYLDRSKQQLMAVDVSADAGRLQVGTPQRLFGVPKGLSYDVTRDGSRFLFVIEVEHRLSPIHVVQNWQPGAPTSGGTWKRP